LALAVFIMLVLLYCQHYIWLQRAPWLETIYCTRVCGLLWLCIE